MLKDFIAGIKFGAVTSAIPLIVIYASGAQAMTNNTGANNSSNNQSNSCDDNGFPPPYAGGAGVAKFFHAADGSTFTITTTGAVIKQSSCHTPYRNGWVNVADICNINSVQDLKGRLSAGSSNPNVDSDFSGCTTSPSNSNSQQTTKTIMIVNNNSQSQSQAQAEGGRGDGSQTTPIATASAQTSTSKTSAQSQVQAQTPATSTSASASTKTLPNTGPGSVTSLAGATAIFSTVGHYVYQTRKRRSYQ